MDDDLWRSRLRVDAYPAPGPGHSRSGVPAFLGKVTSTGSNLGVGKFCQVLPAALTGTESDGSASTATAGPASVIALAIGPTAPATNDFVVVRRVDHRWVFDKQTVGGGSSTTPGFSACCPSNALPSTLSISFTFGGGFNAATYNNLAQNLTLSFFSTPPAYATGAGNNAYFSPTFFDGFGDTCFYRLTCSGPGQIAFVFGTVGFGVSGCGTISVVSCSPFLASGIAGGYDGTFGHPTTNPTCINDNGGGGVAGVFGTHSGDNITIS